MSVWRHPKTQPPWKPCPETRKRGYRTKDDALKILARNRSKAFNRAYECPVCGLWHLTSQPQRIAA